MKGREFLLPVQALLYFQILHKKKFRVKQLTYPSFKTDQLPIIAQSIGSSDGMLIGR
jgi:hypothetical protein